MYMTQCGELRINVGQEDKEKKNDNYEDIRGDIIVRRCVHSFGAQHYTVCQPDGSEIHFGQPPNFGQSKAKRSFDLKNFLLHASAPRRRISRQCIYLYRCKVIAIVINCQIGF